MVTPTEAGATMKSIGSKRKVHSKKKIFPPIVPAEKKPWEPLFDFPLPMRPPHGKIGIWTERAIEVHRMVEWACAAMQEFEQAIHEDPAADGVSELKALDLALQLRKATREIIMALIVTQNVADDQELPIDESQLLFRMFMRQPIPAIDDRRGEVYNLEETEKITQWPAEALRALHELWYRRESVE